MPTFLDATGLSKLLQKIKTVFATKTELTALSDDLTNQANELGKTFVHKTGTETISGNKTFTGGVDIYSAVQGQTASLNIRGNYDGSEGGQINFFAPDSGTQYSGFFIDNYRGQFRLIGLPSADGTTRTGNGTAFYLDPYAKTIGGGYAFTHEVMVNKGDTPAAGAISHVMRVDFKNTSGSITHTTYPISIIGNSNTSNAYNSGVRLGSVNGTTFLTAGESGGTIVAKLGYYDNENCYITADGDIHMFVKCANDSASYAGPISFSGTAKANGTSSTTTVKATTFIGTVSSSSDERLKKDIGDIPDAVLDAWDKIRWKQFRMNYEDDGAPLHTGLIAQEVNGILDAKEHSASQKAESADFDDGIEWRVCYAEALAIEAAYLRRRCKRLELSLADALERIAALEAKGE